MTANAVDAANAAGGPLAIVLSGGGARAAYQAGVLRGVARHFPDTRIPVVVGVSAGAINAAFLAAHSGTLAESAPELSASGGACASRTSSAWTPRR